MNASNKVGSGSVDAMINAFGGRWVIDGVRTKRRSEWYQPMMEAMETIFCIVSDRKRGYR